GGDHLLQVDWRSDPGPLDGTPDRRPRHCRRNWNGARNRRRPCSFLSRSFMIEIDPTRLLATLEALRNIGPCGTGVHRPALTPADLEARLWLWACLVKLGFHARLDRFGTVFGRAPGDAPAILVGSHTDTVPQGGWLDGALGVAYALEIATTRVEALGATAARVDVISFQDEEGSFVA